MKKLLFLATLLLNMTAVMAQNSEGFIEVSNAQELEEAIKANNSAKIQLTDNIEAPDLRKICGTFKGTISGRHKAYDENVKDTIDAMYYIDGGRDKGGAKTWLFDRVDGAKFDGILFKNFRVEQQDGNKLGLIAREVVNSTFSNLTFDNISVFDEYDYAGVIAGIAVGCQFENITTKFSDVTVDGCYAGGIVGDSQNCRFMACTIALTSACFADGSGGNARVGGIVGMSQNDEFLGCVNSGLVGGLSDEIGGIAGRSENSKFTYCNNDYAVLYCDEWGSRSNTVYFRDLVNKTREKVTAMAIDEAKLYHSQVAKTIYLWFGQFLAGALISGLVTAGVNTLILSSNTLYNALVPSTTYPILSEYLASYAASVWPNLVGKVYAITMWASIFTAVAVAIIVQVVVLSIMSATDYDYVGGMCGYAEDCTFESCTNNAEIYSDDEDCGGIVGYAEGGSINNCLNTGSLSNDGSETIASIVGRVTHQTKVTNCVSTKDLPIIGQRDDLFADVSNSRFSDVSEESGNNYRLENDDKSNIYKSYEMQVDNSKLLDGTVAIWLNNGAYNRENGIKPWRQNLSGQLDYYPVLDVSHNEVLPKYVPHIEIRTENDLRNFAQKVNDGEQFCNAVLYNNIEMSPDRQWTPIGTKDHKWRGIFDGQGYTISGLKCSVESNSEEGAGLFGSIEVHADIRNVIIDSSCEIENKSATGAGGIVGTVRNNSRGWGNIVIRNCGNKGNIKGYQHVGGILGRVINDNEDSKVQVAVDSCFHEGSVTADGYSGLLCGYMKNHGVVTNCRADGSLKQSGNNRIYSMNNPSGEAEYFVGYDQRLTIKNCHDYQSDVDWYDLAVKNQTQKGVDRYDVHNITFLNDTDNSFVNTKECTVGEINYTRTFNNTNYQALYIPFELDYKDWCADFDVYRINMFHEYDRDNNGETDECTLEVTIVPSGSIKPNYPYLIKAKTTGTKTLTKKNAKVYVTQCNSIECSTIDTKYTFTGTYDKITNMKAAGYYAMSKGQLCAAQTDAAELGAYRWYMQATTKTNSSFAPKIRIFVSGEDEGATGIDSYSTMDFSNSPTELYTISGQKVNSSNLPAGVYVKNGKKFIKK